MLLIVKARTLLNSFLTPMMNILDKFIKTRSQVRLSKGASAVKNDNVGIKNDANFNMFINSALKGQGQGQENDPPNHCDVFIDGNIQCVADSQLLPPSQASPTHISYSAPISFTT